MGMLHKACGQPLEDIAIDEVAIVASFPKFCALRKLLKRACSTQPQFHGMVFVRTRLVSDPRYCPILCTFFPLCVEGFSSLDLMPAKLPRAASFLRRIWLVSSAGVALKGLDSSISIFRVCFQLIEVPSSLIPFILPLLSTKRGLVHRY